MDNSSASEDATTVVPQPPLTDQQTNMTYPQGSGAFDRGKSRPNLSPVGPVANRSVVRVTVVEVGQVLVVVAEVEVPVHLTVDHHDRIGAVVQIVRVDGVCVLHRQVMVLMRRGARWPPGARLPATRGTPARTRW